MTSKTKQVERALEVLVIGLPVPTEYLLIYRTNEGNVMAGSSLAPGQWIEFMNELKQNMSK
jgi:hypothetical protein